MTIGTELAHYSIKPWHHFSDMEVYFQIPVIAITKTEQKTTARKQKAKKDLQDILKTIKTGLCDLLGRIIEEAYHSGRAGSLRLACQEFGNNEPPGCKHIPGLTYTSRVSTLP